MRWLGVERTLTESRDHRDRDVRRPGDRRQQTDQSRRRDRQSTVGERLRALYPEASGRSLKAWLEAGRVRVNGVVVRRRDAVAREGDRVDLGAPPPAAIPAP